MPRPNAPPLLTPLKLCAMNNKLNLKLVLSLALQGLATNRGRTILTTIGIIIGIATIVIVLSAGRGLETFIKDQIAIFGADTIEVEFKIPSVSDMEMVSAYMGGAEVTTLKVDDFEALKTLPNIKEYYAATLGQYRSVYKNKNVRSTIFAVTAALPEIDLETKIAEGRFFNEREDKAQARVVVLGSGMKNELFGEENALGKTIKINQINFKVIGVMEERGNIMYFNFDKMIYMPLVTAQKQLLGIDHVMYGFMTMHDISRTSETVEEINNIMRRRHGIPPDNPGKDDFRTTSMREAIEITGVVTFGLTLLVLAIAGISLIVGGVGIMNVMYLSVVERTREIGLRKAIGASNKMIKAQFLLEAMLITGMGGVIGIIIGSIFVLLIGFGASLQGYDFQMGIGIDSILVGLGAALIFGVLFGLYPARKASALSPVEALRWE
jgi:putative ABC transport system permease protein